MKFVIDIFLRIFGHKRFAKLNKFLFIISLRGMGLMNYENVQVSGEQRLIKELVEIYSKGIIVDVGANKGSYSQMLCNAGFKGNIMSFEPNPKTYKQLVASTIGRSNIQTIQKGVSKEPGFFELYDYDDKDKCGSEHASLFVEAIEESRKSNSKVYEIECIKLDDLEIEENIFLLKIDTEGNELNVLLGSEELIKSGNIDFIHLEFNEMNVYSKTYFRDFYKLLSDRYHFYRLLPNSLFPIRNYSAILTELFTYQNILCVRKEIGFNY